MKQYPIMCPSCKGTGWVSSLNYSSNAQRECPACGGTKIVMVTDTDDKEQSHE